MDLAPRRSVEAKAEESDMLDFEPYPPIRRQLLNLLRVVDVGGGLQLSDQGADEGDDGGAVGVLLLRGALCDLLGGDVGGVGGVPRCLAGHDRRQVTLHESLTWLGWHWHR